MVANCFSNLHDLTGKLMAHGRTCVYTFLPFMIHMKVGAADGTGMHLYNYVGGLKNFRISDEFA